jgi:RND family efflux transporter MFP subunit
MIALRMAGLTLLWACSLLSTPYALAADEVASVRAATLSSLAIYPALSAPAQVVSLNDSRIESSNTAIVEQIPARVGDVVEAGAELLRLECGDQRNALEQGMAGRDALKARLAFADFQYTRARSLVKSKNISEEQLHQRQADAAALQAELGGAEAAVAQALRNVERCSVRAPFRAVVAERLIGVGEKAQPGKALLRLLDLSTLEVSAQVQAFDADALQQAEALTLLVDSQRYPLRLRSVVPALDPRSRSRELRLDFVAESAPPGSSGRLQWLNSTPHLPAELLLRRDGKYGVYVLRAGRAEFVVIDSAREGSPVAVTLPGDTLIVTEGRYGLHHGDAVNVVE